MPVSIYIATPQGGASNRRIAKLCADEWALAPQVEALADWLQVNAPTLQPDSYVADIGFSPRERALGGGPVLGPSMLGQMAGVGMSLHLSEYPNINE
jgi:hypothetical protein